MASVRVSKSFPPIDCLGVWKGGVKVKNKAYASDPAPSGAGSVLQSLQASNAQEWTDFWRQASFTL